VSKLRVESFSISVDGYGAGPNQSLHDPLGVGGTRLHEWAFATRTFQQQVFGSQGGAIGVDDDFAQRGFRNVGAWILGRNMFGPVRGAWPDDSWKGWWGDDPPYHVPVFVLTHHPRKPLTMDGGTTFTFVTDGMDSALAQARAAAGDKNVAIAGGASAIRQFLAAGHLDELYLHLVPVLLGAGERPLNDVGDPVLEPVEVIASPRVTHIRYRVAR
jgi:dihydrofolate reductase